MCARLLCRAGCAAVILRAAMPALGDPPVLRDPTRPVCELGRSHVVLQWFTRQPCETMVQLRRGRLPCNTPGPDGKPLNVWAGSSVRVMRGAPGRRTWHVLRITGLQPSTRYFYRTYDPQAEPTGQEKRWGASKPWRREYAFSTLAPAGLKTVTRVLFARMRSDDR